MAVRTFAKALPPDVFSMRASVRWAAYSRIRDAAHAPALAERWKTMARMSHARYQSLRGRIGGSDGEDAPQLKNR